jgi:hypothetical protein
MKRKYTFVVTKKFVEFVTNKINIDQRWQDGNQSYDQVAYQWWCEFPDHMLPTVEPCAHVNESYVKEHNMDKKLPFKVDLHYTQINKFVDNKVIAKNGMMTITDRCKKRLKSYPDIFIQPVRWLNKPFKMDENEKMKFIQPKEGDELEYEIGAPMEVQTVLKMVEDSTEEAARGNMTGTKIHIDDSRFEYDPNN